MSRGWRATLRMTAGESAHCSDRLSDAVVLVNLCAYTRGLSLSQRGPPGDLILAVSGEATGEMIATCLCRHYSRIAGYSGSYPSRSGSLPDCPLYVQRHELRGLIN